MKPGRACSAGVSPARSSDQPYQAGETPALQRGRELVSR